MFLKQLSELFKAAGGVADGEDLHFGIIGRLPPYWPTVEFLHPRLELSCRFPTEIQFSVKKLFAQVVDEGEKTT